MVHLNDFGANIIGCYGFQSEPLPDIQVEEKHCVASSHVSGWMASTFGWIQFAQLVSIWGFAGPVDVRICKATRW